MNAPTESDVLDAQEAAKGRKVYKLEVTIGDETYYLIAAKPKKVDFQRLMTETKDAPPAKAMRAQENFVLSCRLWPEEKQVKDLFEDEFALGNAFGAELIAKLGLDAKATSSLL